MIYQRETKQFDAISSSNEIVMQVSGALEKLLEDAGVIYGANYCIKFITDGAYTIMAIITLDTTEKVE